MCCYSSSNSLEKRRVKIIAQIRNLDEQYPPCLSTRLSVRKLTDSSTPHAATFGGLIDSQTLLRRSSGSLTSHQKALANPQDFLGNLQGLLASPGTLPPCFIFLPPRTQKIPRLRDSKRGKNTFILSTCFAVIL